LKPNPLDLSSFSALTLLVWSFLFKQRWTIVAFLWCWFHLHVSWLAYLHGGYTGQINGLLLQENGFKWVMGRHAENNSLYDAKQYNLMSCITW